MAYQKSPDRFPFARKKVMFRFLFGVLAALALTGPACAKDILFGASVQITGPAANTGRYYATCDWPGVCLATNKRCVRSLGR
jgi:hypothetical protein